MLVYEAVFDTNILYSGYGWRGLPFRCLQWARTSSVVSITCQEILDEFEAKLLQKMKLPAVDAAAVVARFRSFSRLVTISNTLRVVAADPTDDKILECAVAGGAGYIVTGDHRHSLPLGSYQGIRIVTAADFLAQVLSTP
jgi:putative PIN family toxin of toxin-antitoxin system